MIVELLEVPAGLVAKDGAPVRAYQRIPLPEAGLVIGGPGSDLIVPEVQDAACRISAASGQARIAPIRRVTADFQKHGVIVLQIDARVVSLRVLPEEAPSFAWPAVAACRAVEAGAPGAASLDVLADALLELGLPLGDRLRAGTSTNEEDGRWLAQFEPLVSSGELQVTWRRAIAERAVIRGGRSAFCGFAGHALFHLIQKLDVIAWTESTHSGPEQVLDLLAEGTLPWLEELRLHHLSSREIHALEREFRTRPAWRRAFPRLRGPTLLRRERLAVETAGKVEEVGDRIVHLDSVPDTGPIPVVWHWVRSFQGAVMLGTSSRELLFNGRALTRPSGNLATWTIALIAGDEFFLEGKQRRIVSLGPQP